jgi:hypothetical protein
MIASVFTAYVAPFHKQRRLAPGRGRADVKIRVAEVVGVVGVGVVGVGVAGYSRCYGIADHPIKLTLCP